MDADQRRVLEERGDVVQCAQGGEVSGIDGEGANVLVGRAVKGTEANPGSEIGSGLGAPTSQLLGGETIQVPRGRPVGLQFRGLSGESLGSPKIPAIAELTHPDANQGTTKEESATSHRPSCAGFEPAIQATQRERVIDRRE